MKGLVTNLLFLSAVLCISVNCLQLASENNDFQEDDSQKYEVVIRMNGLIQKKEDSRCTFIKLERETQFITEIQIKGIKEINHHISLVACEKLPDVEPREDDNSWDCSKVGICGRGETRRIYTWALDAQGIKFEKGVGVKLSGKSDLNYLVINSHYNDAVQPGFRDDKTAYILQMTSQKLPYQVGVYTLGNNGYIPAKRERFHMDSACKVKLRYEIVPIAYRTHAHNVIRVISGYLIRDKEWTELGRYSPKQPQAFYKVTTPNQIVQRGDFLASRCTANTMEFNETTYTGHMHADEMCVFYLMFYTDYKGILSDVYCFKEIYEDTENKFSWENKIPGRAPENSDTLAGVDLIKPEYEFL